MARVSAHICSTSPEVSNRLSTMTAPVLGRAGLPRRRSRHREKGVSTTAIVPYSEHSHMSGELLTNPILSRFAPILHRKETNSMSLGPRSLTSALTGPQMPCRRALRWSMYEPATMHMMPALPMASGIRPR